MSAPARTVLFEEQCPSCSVRAMTSNDGLTATCRNCAAERPVEGLTPRADWPLEVAQKPIVEPVVYYVRFGDRVKIGTTVQLEKRLMNLPYDEVLATEPGGYDVERRRHIKLRASRIYANREWFWLTEEVLEHIATLRASA